MLRGLFRLQGTRVRVRVAGSLHDLAVNEYGLALVGDLTMHSPCAMKAGSSLLCIALCCEAIFPEFLPQNRA